MLNIKSTRRAFWFFLPAEYAHVHAALAFWGRGQFFCRSLLSAYWVLSAYFLAVFEISVCAYQPVYTVLFVYSHVHMVVINNTFTFPTTRT